MFGLFKSKYDQNELRLKSEFDAAVRQIKSSEIEKQGMVGLGIRGAEGLFEDNSSLSSFRGSDFNEQMKILKIIDAAKVEINQMDGPIRIMHLGYALYIKYLSAVMSSNAHLVDGFEQELIYFKKVAASLKR